MGINVRLDDKQRRRLCEHAADAGVSISEFVRRAIAEKLERDKAAEVKKTAYEGLIELGIDFDSGHDDRSARHREIFAEEVDRKRRSGGKRPK